MQNWGMGLGGISRVTSALTRSISAENPTGAPGQGGKATEGTGSDPAADLGIGWKVSPYVNIPAGGTFHLAEI